MNKTFHISDQIKCVEREIDMRRRVYPSRIIAGKMTQGTADREIEIMRHVYQTLIDISNKKYIRNGNDE